MTTATQQIPAGYKQTEIGVIPADWDVKRLGEIADVVTGNTPPTNDRANYGEEYFFVSPADLGKGKYVLQTGKRLSKKGFDISRRFPKNSILFTCIGSTIGKSGIAPIELTSNQQINAILPNDNFSSDFLFYFLNLIAPQIQSLAGEQAVPIVNKTEFESTVIALPSDKTEQTAIAAALSDIDALIEKLDKLLEKKKLIKHGTMQELLTSKRRLPGFSGKWEMRKLGEVVGFDRGRDLSKSDLSEYGNYRCIHYGQLFTEYKELIREIKSRTNINTGCFYSKVNDVLMPTSDVTPRGLATASCIKEDGVILGGGILVIRFRPGYDGLYLSYFVSQNKPSILKLVKGSTVFHLYASDLANLEIGFPEPKEQTAIANTLSDMDVEIEKLETQLVKYQNLKRGMMQTLLTGKIRLVK